MRFGCDAFGCVDEHGNVVGLDVLGFDDRYVVADPGALEQALVTDRDALAPFFSMRQIGKRPDEMVAQTERRSPLASNGTSEPTCIPPSPGIRLWGSSPIQSSRKSASLRSNDSKRCVQDSWATMSASVMMPRASPPVVTITAL